MSAVASAVFESLAVESSVAFVVVGVDDEDEDESEAVVVAVSATCPLV
jgi:hypothetical protein